MNLAALWDFIDTSDGQEALLVAIEGHHALAVTRLLSERATLRFPHAKVAAASVGEVAWESFKGGVTTPVSPYRPLGCFIGLEGGRSENDVRIGYDLVFRCGGSVRADVSITLKPDGAYLIEDHGKSANAAFMRPAIDEADRMFNTSNEETDAILSLLSLPPAFGSGAIPGERHINRVDDPTESELQVYNKLLAWNWPLLVADDLLEAELQQDVTSLLREKLTPLQVQVVETLLNDAKFQTDFFTIIAVAKEL